MNLAEVTDDLKLFALTKEAIKADHLVTDLVPRRPGAVVRKSKHVISLFVGGEVD
jgi:hypothetical protein